MKLTFLGTGGAFINDSTVEYDGSLKTKNFHSNILIETLDSNHSKRRFLFDCGSDIRFSLAARGFSPGDVDAVYISHLHGDHMGGLEFLGFHRHFSPNSKKPMLFANPYLIEEIWAALEPAMGELEGKQLGLSDYFEVLKILDRQFHQFNLVCEMVQTSHIFGCRSMISSFGLMLSDHSNETVSSKIFITSDTQLNLSALMPSYQTADVIFQDCETTKYKSGVHAHYDHLKLLPEDIRAKMWLYHYNSPVDQLPNAISDGFKGFVKPGESFEFDNPKKNRDY